VNKYNWQQSPTVSRTSKILDCYILITSFCEAHMQFFKDSNTLYRVLKLYSLLYILWRKRTLGYIDHTSQSWAEYISLL